MALFKAKALVDGQETEVELDDEVFLTREQHQVQLDRTVQDRLGRQKRSIQSDLEKDEEFVAKLLKSRGLDPTAKPGEVPAELVERFQKELREKELTPVQQELEKMRGELTGTRARFLEGELERALVKAGVKPAMAGRLAKMEAGGFGYDEETRSFAVRDGDGFAFSSNASKERPYKGVEDFAKEWAANPDNADFVVEPQQQSGPGVGRDTTTRQNTGKVAKKSDLKDAASKARYIGEHGVDAYMDLPD